MILKSPRIVKRHSCYSVFFLARMHASLTGKGPTAPTACGVCDLSGILLSTDYYKLTGNDHARRMRRVKCPVVRANRADGSASR